MQTMRNERQSKRLETFEKVQRSRLAELKNHVDQLRRVLVIEDAVDDDKG
jgi:hypothetical protein